MSSEDWKFTKLEEEEFHQMKGPLFARVCHFYNHHVYFVSSSSSSSNDLLYILVQGKAAPHEAAHQGVGVLRSRKNNKRRRVWQRYLEYRWAYSRPGQRDHRSGWPLRLEKVSEHLGQRFFTKKPTKESGTYSFLPLLDSVGSLLEISPRSLLSTCTTPIELPENAWLDGRVEESDFRHLR